MFVKCHLKLHIDITSSLHYKKVAPEPTQLNPTQPNSCKRQSLTRSVNVCRVSCDERLRNHTTRASLTFGTPPPPTPWSREHDVTATDHLIRFSLMAVSPAVTYRGLVQRTCRAQRRRAGNVAYLPPPLGAGSLLASSNIV